jgi:threonine-phosphate decarboxylase
MAPVSPRTHGGDPWTLLREQALAQDQILDFSIDVNPLGFPEMVRSAILQYIEEIRCYPDPDALPLRETIARCHDVPVDTVLPGNGSAELIMLVARLRPGARALVVMPTFTEYAWAVEQSGSTVVPYPLHEARGFQSDFSMEDWAERADASALMFLCNPNNPTGVAWDKARVLWLADRCRQRGCLLVVDEAYVELTDQPERLTVLPEALRYDNLLVLRSLTKLFAVPGLRLGYLVAARSLVERLRALQQPWPLNTFAIRVGTELLKQQSYIAQSQQLLRALRPAFHHALAQIPGLTPFPAAANFVMCRLESPAMTSDRLAQRLADQRIVVRNCDSIPGLEPGRFIRLAIRMPAENEQLFTALREALRHGG